MNHVEVKSFFTVEVFTPGENPYQVGPQHETLESAIYFRDVCQKPKIGKRNGFKKKTELKIFRFSLFKTLIEIK